jgi:aldehyde dehydrogenase (NAD+)
VTPSAEQARAAAAHFAHWVDGRAWDGVGTGSLPVRNPVDGSVVGHLPAGREQEVANAVASARGAGPGWADLAPQHRGERLLAVAAAVEEHLEQLCALECAETGKPHHVARDELLGAADYFRFYGAAARTLTGQTFDVGPSRHLFVQREPYGVVGMITPWNYAANQAARGAAPALAAGNTVVVKPSEYAATTILRVAELASGAGLPPGVLNVVVGAGDAGAALVAHPGVDRLTFTGSVTTGRRVAVAAAQRLVPVTLELGGKSPHLVFADADLDAAAEDVASAIFYHAGQTCSAGSRLLVQADVHDELVERVVSRARSLRPGRDFGPIITEAQHRTVLSYLELAGREGAVAAVGGTAGLSADGWYVEPTVFTAVDNSMRIAREEIFGPVLVAIAFSDEEEAVATANDSPYALVAGIWTRDLDRAFRVARRVEAGQVYVNGWGGPIEVPFGGSRNSGYGREKGLSAIEEYTRPKGICLTISSGSGR